MSSQPTPPTCEEIDYIDVDATLLPQLQSIIMAPASPTTSSPNFHGINISPDETEPTELEPVEKSLEDRMPKVGMKFCTEQEAYDFYNAYTRDKGFSIRRSSSHNVKNTTTIKNSTFCCSRAGIRGTDKREKIPSIIRVRHDVCAKHS